MYDINRFFTITPLICLSILAFTSFLLIHLSIFVHPNAVLGQDQPVSDSKLQTWIDNLSNIKVEFTNSPGSPVIDKPTQLKFDVAHLQNGTKLSNLSARVIVLASVGEQQRSFIFPNVVSHNGSFSVKYLFPYYGSYQVISKIDSRGLINLASFNVFVPIQAGATTNTANVSLLIFAASIAGIIGIAIVMGARYIQPKRRGQE